VISPTVARRYAKALIELGRETGNLDALVREIGAVAELIETNAELRALIGNPQIPRASRKAVLADIVARIGVGPITRNTIALLTDNNRLGALPAIAIELRAEADRRAGIARAHVTSAAPLDEAYVHELTQVLESRFQKKVLVQRTVDPALLAGVVTRIGDTIIDGSLRARIGELRSELLPR
jgi:F-type H+-transporting ATPase subunit delta